MKKNSTAQLYLNCVVPVLALTILQACVPRQQSNHYDNNFKSMQAGSIDAGVRGNFQVSKDANAADVKSAEIFTNGCAVIGASGSTSQVDLRLTLGDTVTETFEDSGLSGLRRSFVKREKVAGLDNGGLDIKTVGQIRSLTSNLEYTRICSTMAATATSVQTVSCGLSPSTTVNTEMDESEPCAFNADETQTLRSRGTYTPPGAGTAATFNAYQIQVNERGTLNCGINSYKNINHTVLEIVSNEVPTLDTAMCGGTVTFRYVSYTDDAKKVFYNARREVKFASRFAKASTN